MRIQTLARSVGLALCFAAMAASLTLTAAAQDAEHDWTKSYQVSQHPQLTLEAGDSGMDVHSCGTCSAIHIAVHSDRKLSDYVLTEHQEGDHVFFSLKEKPHIGFHINMTMHSNTRITVETPASLALDARVSDGSLAANGLSGDLKLHSSDGSVHAEDVHGRLDFHTSDGSVTIRRASGEIDANSSDGSVDVEGQFNRLNLHTSDGSITLALAEGSKLTAPSSIRTSDGHVQMRLPRALDADLDVTASDGRIDCELPLKMDGYNSKGSEHHHIAGHLNAGGAPLEVKLSDGSVKIAAL